MTQMNPSRELPRLQQIWKGLAGDTRMNFDIDKEREIEQHSADFGGGRLEVEGFIKCTGNQHTLLSLRAWRLKDRALDYFNIFYLRCSIDTETLPLNARLNVEGHPRLTATPIIQLQEGIDYFEDAVESENLCSR